MSEYAPWPLDLTNPSFRKPWQRAFFPWRLVVRREKKREFFPGEWRYPISKARRSITTSQIPSPIL